MSNESNKTVLSFFNTCLKENDLALLDDDCWLNDNIINFAFDYFTHVQFSDHKDDLVFLTTGVVSLAKFVKFPEFELIVRSLKLQKKSLVFVPVNDGSSTTELSGRHWSLLVFCRGLFYYLDSILESGNLEIAKTLANYLAPIWGTDCDPGVNVVSGCTQQTNSYDCGVHCILFAEEIASQYTNGVDTWQKKIEPKVDTTSKRKDLRNLILDLSQKHQEETE